MNRNTVMSYVNDVKKFMEAYAEELQENCSFFIGFHPYLEYGYYDEELGWVTHSSEEYFTKEEANLLLDEVIKATDLQESDGMICQVREQIKHWC